MLNQHVNDFNFDRFFELFKQFKKIVLTRPFFRTMITTI